MQHQALHHPSVCLKDINEASVMKGNNTEKGMMIMSTPMWKVTAFAIYLRQYKSNVMDNLSMSLLTQVTKTIQYKDTEKH